MVPVRVRVPLIVKVWPSLNLRDLAAVIQVRLLKVVAPVMFAIAPPVKMTLELSALKVPLLSQFPVRVIEELDAALRTAPD